MDSTPDHSPTGAAGSGPAGLAADPSAADEIARLSAENARLRAEAGPAAEHRAGRRWRAFFAVLLIAVGALLAPVSVVAYWTKGEVTDTDRFVALLAPLAEDPAIQSYLVGEIVTVVNDNVDIDTITSDLFAGLEGLDLPPAAKNALGLLEQPAAQGVQQLIRTAATRIVESDAFADLWANALRVSHTQVVSALEGDSSSALAISDSGEVGIQLGPIIDQVKTELVNRGFSLAQNIPEVNRTIVIAQSDALVQARTGYQLLNLLGFVLPIVSIGLLVVGVFVANRRSRALIWAGLSLTASMALLSAAIALGRILFVNSVSPQSLPTGTAEAFYDAVIPFMNNTALAVGLVGFTVAVVGYLAGPFRGARALRRVTVDTTARLRVAAEDAGVTTGRFGEVLYRSRRLAHVLIGLGAAAVAIFWRPLPVSVIIWTAVLALVLVLLVELLQRPPAEPVGAARPNTITPATQAEPNPPGTGPGRSETRPLPATTPAAGRRDAPTEPLPPPPSRSDSD